MLRLSELEIFVEVVERCGFSAAARALNLSKAQTSKAVARLEERLGARLLNRTTRKLSLTEIGAAFFQRCRQVVKELEDAELAVGQLQSAPRGTLRITAPVLFGMRYLAEPTAKFAAKYPELRLDLDLNDRHLDLVEEGYDLAIRIGVLQDTPLLARKIAPVELMLAASPAYLAARGVPTHPEELRDHECLRYSYQLSGQQWLFQSGDEQLAVPTRGRILSNNGEFLRVAACEGQGIVMLPDFILNEDIKIGLLVRLMKNWTIQEAAIWAIYPHSRHLLAKVRLYIDYLLENLCTGKEGRANWSMNEGET